jgi:cysteine desulfurase
MSDPRTYLDHNASSTLRPEARAAMLAALEAIGNPSSIHAEGRHLRGLIEAARDDVAALVGARPDDVVFTSGGTEACNLVIGAGWDTIALAPVEHVAVTAPARRSGATIVALEVSSAGIIGATGLEAMTGRSLLAVQLANNETGVVQPVADIAAAARTKGCAVFSDITQAAGKLPVDLATLGADVVALSAHKLGGPKGVGALALRRGFDLAVSIAGGGQERGRRAGTENVAGIAGFGAAARCARRDLTTMPRTATLRDQLASGLRALTPDIAVIGETAPRLANTLSVAWPGAKAETLVMALDLEGVAVSAGAACSSGKVGHSAVLEAMRLPVAIRDSAIRVSLGWSTTSGDIDRFLAAWARVSDRFAQRRVA